MTSTAPTGRLLLLVLLLVAHATAQSAVALLGTDEEEFEEEEVPDCEDQDPNCEAWGEMEECDSNPGFMLANCPVTCGTCIPKTNVTSCSDLDEENCPGWAARGDCQRNPAFMLDNCARSCRSCLPTEPSECVDYRQDCYIGALARQCVDNPSYYHRFCSYSCRAFVDVCNGAGRSVITEICEAANTECGIDPSNRRMSLSEQPRSQVPEEGDDNDETPEGAEREVEGETTVDEDQEENEIESTPTDLPEDPNQALAEIIQGSFDIETRRRATILHGDVGSPGNVNELGVSAWPWQNHRPHDRLVRPGPLYGPKSWHKRWPVSKPGRKIQADDSPSWTSYITGFFNRLSRRWFGTFRKSRMSRSLKGEMIQRRLGRQLPTYGTTTNSIYSYFCNRTFTFDFGEECVEGQCYGGYTFSYDVCEVTITTILLGGVALTLMNCCEDTPEPPEPEEPTLDIDAVLSGAALTTAVVATVVEAAQSTVTDATITPAGFTVGALTRALVPYCEIEGYDSLTSRLEALRRASVGFPLPKIAGEMIKAINFCQYGFGNSNQAFVGDIIKDAPDTRRIPLRWPGISFPALYYSSSNFSLPSQAAPLNITTSTTTTTPVTPTTSATNSTITSTFPFVNTRSPATTSSPTSSPETASPTSDTSSPSPSTTNPSPSTSTPSSGSSAGTRFPVVQDQFLPRRVTNLTLGSRSTWKCGGSLITANHVITAAHCVVGSRRPQRIRLGEIDLTIPDESQAFDYGVRDVTVHPDYDAKGPKHNDIAIITLEQKVDFSRVVRPYCLAREAVPLDGRLCYASGWGTRANDRPSNVISDYELRVVSTPECQQLFRNTEAEFNPSFVFHYPRGITEEFVCASAVIPGEDTCRGDSGGPLVLEESVTTRGRVQLEVGVVSSGFACGDAKIPGLYARIDTYKSWIDGVIGCSLGV